ncbi:AzlD domain-containing protein [Lacticaseibacillus jixiensis]|uniref:AzlD domain-containing protein n=1 Tax=Lacticaseibacillus jixiensis TaxID=3231926 RepID=UPI0036F1F69B
MNEHVFITILLCGLVTWLIRVVPFALVKAATLPKWLLQFLSFVPVAILSAIFVESLLVYHSGHWPSVNVENLMASVPSIIAGVISKSLLVVVVVGIVAMALIRALGWA